MVLQAGPAPGRGGEREHGRGQRQQGLRQETGDWNLHIHVAHEGVEYMDHEHALHEHAVREDTVHP